MINGRRIESTAAGTAKNPADYYQLVRSHGDAIMHAGGIGVDQQK
jgi:hypothetical protein